jgi:hypothetical protein
LENLKGRYHSEIKGVDGKIMLEWVLWEREWEVVEWTNVVQDRDQWRALSTM